MAALIVLWAGRCGCGEPGERPSVGGGISASASRSLFAGAIGHAQKRCVKILGAAVAREHGYATGIVVSGDGLILTAQGILLSGSRIRVVLPDGSEHEARVVRQNPGLLVALLKIEARTPDYFELAGAPVGERGDWVIAVANPFKVAEGVEPLSVNLGILSLRCEMDAKRRAQEVSYDGEVLLVDCITSNPGSPGGALLTVDGRLAGMVGKIIESQNTNTRMNYAVPVDLLKRFVEARGEDSDPVAQEGTPYLGLRLFTLSGSKAPAYIDRVVSGSPAEAAGLRKDDLILALGEDDVRSVREYQKVEEKLKPGQQVVLSIKRQQEFRKFTLTVAARPKEGGGAGE